MALGHVVLAGAVLEGERGVGEDAAGVEEVVERGQLLVGRVSSRVMDVSGVRGAMR